MELQLRLLPTPHQPRSWSSTKWLGRWSGFCCCRRGAGAVLALHAGATNTSFGSIRGAFYEAQMLGNICVTDSQTTTQCPIAIFRIIFFFVSKQKIIFRKIRKTIILVKCYFPFFQDAVESYIYRL